MALEAKQVNIRVTFAEEACIRGAAAALEVEISNFLEVAMMQQVADLDMMLVDPSPPRLKAGYEWPFHPARPDGESAKTRVTCHASGWLFPTFEAAAWALRASLPMFAIGSALRLAALLKLANERATKNDPKRVNVALGKVDVPYGFDELVRR